MEESDFYGTPENLVEEWIDEGLIDIKRFITYDQATEIVKSNDYWEDDFAVTDPDDIANLITFDNAHLVARSLYLEGPSAARALREELSYWCKNTSC